MRPLLSPTQRNRSRVVLTVLSGTLAATTVAGTGAATVAVARETAREDAVAAQAKAVADDEAARAHHEALVAWAAENPEVVTVPRPVRTVVGPDVVTRASSPGTARVGGSSGRSSSSRSSSSGSSGSSGRSSARSRPAPPPPPPVASAGS